MRQFVLRVAGEMFAAIATAADIRAESPAPHSPDAPPEPRRRIGLDIGSALARFDADGQSSVASTSLYATRLVKPGRLTEFEWLAGRNDRWSDPTAPFSETVAIADIVDPETEIAQDVLSTAAQRIFQSLRAEWTASGPGLHREAQLAYAVPDDLDEFSQRALRSAIAGSFGQAYPIWRSVATVFGWQQTSGFKEARVKPGDVVVVFDATAGDLTATFVLARRSDHLAKVFPATLGLYWERRPSLSSQSLPPDLQQLAANLSFPRMLADHLRHAIATDPNSSSLTKKDIDLIVDRLVREGGVEAAVCDGRPLQVLLDGVQSVTALHLPADPAGFALRLDVWLESLRGYLNGLATNALFLGLLNELHEEGGSILFLFSGAPVGLRQSRTRITSTDLPAAFHGIRTWTCPDSDGFVAAGARHFLERVQHGLPGWEDWLPDLYLDVVRDEQFYELQLLRENKVSATLGEILPPFQVPETLRLPAGQAIYRFPLFSGRQRQPLPYDAMITSDHFPLLEDTEARLVLTHRYGLDNAYELTIYPADTDRAPFPPLLAQWAHRPRVQSSAPPFPPPRPWNSYADLIDKQDWFIKQSSKFVDRCERLFPDLPETAGQLRHFERDWRSGEWKSFAEWMKRGLEFPMRICWDEGRVLADAPEVLAEAADAGIINWLMNLVGVRDDRLPAEDRRDPRYQPEMWHVRNVALMLLCRLHRDAPMGVAELMAADLRHAADRAWSSGQDWGLREPLGHVRFLLGDGRGPSVSCFAVLTDLMQSYFHDKPRAPQVQVDLLRTFSMALWRNAEFVHSLARHLKGKIPWLLDTVLEVFEELGNAPQSFAEIRKFIFGSQIILALLRLRETPEYEGFLRAGSPGLVRIARHVRRLDRIFEENGVIVWSNVQFNLKKPETLGRMSDLAYALNCYLTGDSGSGLIGISSVREEEGEGQGAGE